MFIVFSQVASIRFLSEAVMAVGITVAVVLWMESK